MKTWLCVLGACLLAGLSPASLSAQSRRVQYGNQQWFQAYLRADLNQGWVMLADGGYRFRSAFAEPSQYLIRVAGGYQFPQGIRLSTGMAQLGFMGDGELYRLEWRSHQEVSWHQSWRKWRLSHRFRTEQRYFLTPEAGGWQHPQSLVYRHRYRLLLKIPLGSQERRRWLVQLGDELLLQTGSGILHRFFSQNRGLLGIGWKGPEGLALTATYSHQFTAKRQVGQYVQTYIAWIGIRYRWKVFDQPAK
ncbi:MAG: DUF2490 domain-containing protein [Bacteroidota bacterium]